MQSSSGASLALATASIGLWVIREPAAPTQLHGVLSWRPFAEQVLRAAQLPTFFLAGAAFNGRKIGFSAAGALRAARLPRAPHPSLR